MTILTHFEIPKHFELIFNILQKNSNINSLNHKQIQFISIFRNQQQPVKTDDNYLIKRIGNNDKNAFEELFEKYYVH